MSAINHENKSVFIHIPKTAGTSMEKIVGGTGHKSLNEISQEADVSDYFKWCFVRNPFDRLASFYFNIRNTQGTEGLIKSRHQTLESFILELERYFPEDYQYKTIQPEHQNIHIIPMDYFMISDDLRMDYIGKYENLPEDWNYISNKLGITTPLSHKNKSKGELSYRSLYTTEMEDIVRRLYVDDFRYYPFL